MYDIIKLCEIYYRQTDKRREYMRNYIKDRYHRVRGQLIEQLGSKCKKCGSTKNLQLDHIDKKKKTIDINNVNSVSGDKLKQELKNIQLLCKDCHKEKTHESWDYGTNRPKHGTYWMYRKYECRCKKCKEAYKEYNKKWNNREK